MKIFIVSICIFALIVVGGIFFSEYMDGISNELSELNAEVKVLIEKEDFGKASELADDLSKIIDDRKIVLASTIDHQTLDNIERNIAELCSYSESGQRFDALAKCEVLEVLFKHLPKNYAVKVENIL